MSTEAPPPELKHLNLYLQRATELATREPVIAYFCKYYAAKLAIDSAAAKGPEGQAFLLALLDALEADKSALEAEHEDALTSDTVGYSVVENFALRIFLNADNEDRAGAASKKTAKTFLAASIFLEVLKVFGEVDAEIAEKIKYAKFKAADITKALKEGRTPIAGPPGAGAEGQGAEEREDVLALEQGGSTDLPAALGIPPATAPSKPSSASSPHTPAKSAPPPPKPTTPIFPETLDGEDAGPNPFALDHAQLMLAQKWARHAVSSLQYDDVVTAVENLERALALLRPFLPSGARSTGP